jgi:hypothetical protein
MEFCDIRLVCFGLLAHPDERAIRHIEASIASSESTVSHTTTPVILSA